MFVDICCGIVEDIGTDIVGIYRVPGNTAGVSYLQEELKGGPEEANFGDSVSLFFKTLIFFFRTSLKKEEDFLKRCRLPL